MSFDNRWGLPSEDLISLVRRVNMSGESLTAGIETHLVAGIPVRVYYVPKTIDRRLKAMLEQLSN